MPIFSSLFNPPITRNIKLIFPNHSIMSPPPSIRQPGDIVNEIYSETIQSIIEICLNVGDDPSSLIEQAKRELQVIYFHFLIK
jgi:hypothetical protein